MMQHDDGQVDRRAPRQTPEQLADAPGCTRITGVAIGWIKKDDAETVHFMDSRKRSPGIGRHHPRAVARAQRVDVFLQDGLRGSPALEEDAAPGTARDRLESKPAASREDVRDNNWRNRSRFAQQVPEL